MLNPFLSSTHQSLPTAITEVQLPVLEQKGIQILVKRDDLIHPEISGNKWRKLYLNLQAAQRQQAKTLVTFGGAFSNHILAVAASGYHLNMPTHGFIRGEARAAANRTLSRAQELGMHLHFVSRSAFRDKQSLLDQFPLKKDAYILPEGGTNVLAVKGCTAIVREVEEQLSTLPEYWCCSVGTGGTVAGLILGLAGSVHITGFSSLKGSFLTGEVQNLLAQTTSKQFNNWSINTQYHFGGYAKWSQELISFMNSFKATQGIPLDPVYTGKLFYGILDLVKKDHFPRGSQILVLHTGGLQGIAGFNERFGNLLT